jgi:hypothetical protein
MVPSRKLPWHEFCKFQLDSVYKQKLRKEFYVGLDASLFDYRTDRGCVGFQRHCRSGCGNRKNTVLCFFNFIFDILDLPSRHQMKVVTV